MRVRIGIVCATLVACEPVEEIDDGLTGTIIGIAGGFVTSSDGVLTVVFPAGALRETVVITMRIADDAPASLGTAYSVQGVSSLATPIFLEYRYTLPQVDGRDLAALDVARATSKHWEPLQRIDLDAHTQTVSASDASVASAYGLVIGDVADDEPDLMRDSAEGGTTSEDPTASSGL